MGVRISWLITARKSDLARGRLRHVTGLGEGRLGRAARAPSTWPCCASVPSRPATLLNESTTWRSSSRPSTGTGALNSPVSMRWVTPSREVTARFTAA